MSRDAFMYELRLLEWKQEEIGELLNLEQSTVSKNIPKLKESDLGIKYNYYDKHKPRK